MTLSEGRPLFKYPVNKNLFSIYWATIQNTMSGVRKKAYALKVYWKEKLKKSKKMTTLLTKISLSSTQYGSCWTYTI